MQHHQHSLCISSLLGPHWPREGLGPLTSGLKTLKGSSELECKYVHTDTPGCGAQRGPWGCLLLGRWEIWTDVEG